MQNKDTIIYHGTDSYFDVIDLNQCNWNTDFGHGFYLSENYNTALKRVRNKLDGNDGIGYVYSYSIPSITELRNIGFNVKLFRGADISWIDFIIKNRKDTSFIHPYDIIIGPTADANTITLINKFLRETNRNKMDKANLIDKLDVSKYGIQYCFCSQISLDYLQMRKIKTTEVYFKGGIVQWER